MKKYLFLKLVALILATFVSLSVFSQETDEARYSKPPNKHSANSNWYFYPFSVNITPGVWLPIGKLSEYYKPSFQLGFGLGFRITSKTRLDIGLTPRFLIGKNKVETTINNTIVQSNKAMGGSIGGWVNYNAFKNKFLFTEFVSGFHFEPLDIENPHPTSSNDSTINISTWGISCGINTWMNIFRKQNFGIRILYPYAPYNRDKQLISDIGGHSASVSLCYKFPKRSSTNKIYYEEDYQKTRRYNTVYPIYIPVKAPTIPDNNVVKDIPKYPNGDLFTYYILAKQKQEQLELSVPENGYDSLLIRMWFTYPEGRYQFGELVELRVDTNNVISARYTMLNIFFNSSRRYEVINSHWDTLMTPKCGWKAFMDTLNDLQITKLPTIESIPKYIAINGKNKYDYGNSLLTVSVEVATKNEYRFFQYNNFKKYKDIDEVNRMYRFELFQRLQLGLRENDDGWY